MQVDLGKTQIRDRRRLKGVQHNIGRGFPRLKPTQQFAGFLRCHFVRMPLNAPFETTNLSGTLNLESRGLRLWLDGQVMPKEAVSILHQIDDDENIQQQDHQYRDRKLMDQLKDFDRDEKKRLANGH